MNIQDKEEIIIMTVDNFWRRPPFFIRPFMRLFGHPTTRGEMITIMMNKYDEDIDRRFADETTTNKIKDEVSKNLTNEQMNLLYIKYNAIVNFIYIAYKEKVINGEVGTKLNKFVKKLSKKDHQISNKFIEDMDKEIMEDVKRDN